ncbi:MAG: peptidylprolyl isomerase [Alphaproteobacteria bacterium]|nr:peptidylprolyl isomerase [Alphaproteobacteria bacterium]MBV9370685.1 peptidylprolyl isomerase [Alphaproteobacteria bacterium]MBV9899968.1 peptidylprolyl isomerase [Alphaproteobacteria bacterium]
MRLKAFFILLAGLFLATAAAAQSISAPPPVPPLDPENTLLLDLSTGGRVAIQLRPDVAPRHVERIKTLARRGFYNGLTFHRVIDGFMAQGGDPKGDGSGGSDLPDLAAEFNGLPHVRGALSAARTEAPNTANSQFFIMLAPKLSLDGQYTVFGRVVSGMAFVDAIEKGEPPANPTRILQASIAADNRPPPAPGLAVAAPAAPAPSLAAQPAHAAAGPAVPPPPSIRVPDPPAPPRRKQ